MTGKVTRDWKASRRKEPNLEVQNTQGRVGNTVGVPEVPPNNGAICDPKGFQTRSWVVRNDNPPFEVLLLDRMNGGRCEGMGYTDFITNDVPSTSTNVTSTNLLYHTG